MNFKVYLKCQVHLVTDLTIVRRFIEERVFYIKQMIHCLLLTFTGMFGNMNYSSGLAVFEQGETSHSFVVGFLLKMDVCNMHFSELDLYNAVLHNSSARRKY